ncbi:BatA domain-containing protein [Hymenobacter weizhouensis]|uniref:BatA domain-containing protein n=1 Tax=Hymenobacter sp. YIM 151500-1 TaxID=2987689 RepID=UPI002226DE6B|nr:BatA domain-containing protein [Hymenobacter sp. YIM 151500-1]UYZ62018.1 BatA domain-containing protein [Hymenobacter sp. YIM 151500-1]
MPAFFVQHAFTGWLALLGLAVPVAIYLWNRRPGRVVQVGSLRWLEAAANRRLRSLRPEQLLLLLVRAAVLGLLALAVAGPTQQLPAPPRRGQVLLSPQLSPAALSGVVPLVDSLRQRGYEVRTLAPGLPLLSPEQWAQRRAAAGSTAAPAPTVLTALPPDSSAAAGPVWSLVRQAADSLPGRPLLVVAPTLLSDFRGTRPTLPPTVQWYPVPAPDSVVWPVAAWAVAPGRLALLLGRGSETGIHYQTLTLNRPRVGATVPVPGLPGAVLQAGAAPGHVRITRAGASYTVPVHTRALRLHLSHDAAHTPDARVLRAALRAAGSVLPLAPRLTVSQAPPTASDSLDWLFWLRDDAVPAVWQRRIAQGLQLWQDAPAPGTVAPTSVAVPGSSSIVRIQRLSLPTKVALDEDVRWTTATGQPLLIAQHQGHGRRYRLHTRLHPAWSELADSPDLPALLLPLLLPPRPPQPDPRLLDAAQLPSVPAAPASAPPVPAGPTRDLTPWVVLAAGLLFGAERWLAARSSVVSSPVAVPA